MDTYIVVGLGNPGLEYMHTKHNAGFDTVNCLLNRWNTALTKEKFKGRLTEINRNGKKIVLCEPQTFMNLSGECVLPLMQWYKIPSDHLLVVYDDIDLPLGKLRVRPNGSAGTHNGMRSILAQLPGGQFPRLRIGVGAKPEGWSLVNWVMSKPQTAEDTLAMRQAFEEGAQCIEDWIDHGIQYAMRNHNKK